MDRHHKRTILLVLVIALLVMGARALWGQTIY